MKLDSARNLKADVTSLFTAGVIPSGGGEGYYDLRSGGVRAFDLRARPPGSGGEDPDGDDVDLGATDITGGSAEEAAP